MLNYQSYEFIISFFSRFKFCITMFRILLLSGPTMLRSLFGSLTNASQVGQSQTFVRILNFEMMNFILLSFFPPSLNLSSCKLFWVISNLILIFRGAITHGRYHFRQQKSVPQCLSSITSTVEHWCCGLKHWWPWRSTIQHFLMSTDSWSWIHPQRSIKICKLAWRHSW